MTVQKHSVERLEGRNQELVTERDKVERELLSVQDELDKERKQLNEAETKSIELQGMNFKVCAFIVLSLSLSHTHTHTHTGVSQSQMELIESLKSRIAEANKETARVKQAQNDSEKAKASVELKLRDLQQSYDQLNKNYEVMYILYLY